MKYGSINEIDLVYGLPINKRENSYRTALLVTQ